MFPESIKTNYRVVKTVYGTSDESEWTIPLGSWKKGGGLAGKKGHVYVYADGWAAVWFCGRHSAILDLQRRHPSIVLMQRGDGETTFRIPMTDLAAILPTLGAKRRFKASEGLLATLERARSASPIGKPCGRKAKNDQD